MTASLRRPAAGWPSLADLAGLRAASGWPSVARRSDPTAEPTRGCAAAVEEDAGAVEHDPTAPVGRWPSTQAAEAWQWKLADVAAAVLPHGRAGSGWR